MIFQALEVICDHASNPWKFCGSPTLFLAPHAAAFGFDAGAMAQRSRFFKMKKQRAASRPARAPRSFAVPFSRKSCRLFHVTCYTLTHEPLARQPTEGRATCPAHVRARHSRGRPRRTLRARLRTRRTKGQQDLLLRLSPPQTIRHRNQMPARTLPSHEPLLRAPRAV